MSGAGGPEQEKERFVANDSSGRSTIIGALLIAVGLVVGAYAVSGALDRTNDQLALVVEALEARPAAGAAPTARPDRPRRPDPAEEYEVEVGQAPVRGNEDAAVTIVEWSDFQCPFCNRAMPTLAKIEEEYGDDVRIVFKHLPLSIHPQAPAAHAAAEAAHRQGKFWEMHDRIFENQRDLKPSTFERYAEEIGLDVDRFRKDVASADVKKRIDDDMRQGSKLGVSGTPAFFINGRFISGAQPFVNFKRVIDEVLEKQT
jgi:protein-disulfide isomerase